MDARYVPIRQKGARSFALAATLAAAMVLQAGLIPAAPLHAQSVSAGVDKPDTGVGSAFELVFWQSVADSEDRAQFEAYLKKYPNGTFSDLARAKLASLTRPAAPAAPAPPPRMVRPATPAPRPVAAPPTAAPAPVTAAVLPVRATGVAPAATPPPPMTAAAAGNPLVPPRPQLLPVASVNLPASFCTLGDRIDFHHQTFVPAQKDADENNRIAIAHLETLQTLNRDLLARNDTDNANVIATEAQSYKAVADRSYQASAGFGPVYERLMTVPIRRC